MRAIDIDRGAGTSGHARAHVNLRRCPQGLAVMFRAHFLALPVHAGGALVVDLHPVHPDISFASLRIAGDHAGQRDKPARVFGPALQDGEIEQREVLPLDHFLAWARGHALGEKLPHFRQHGKHLYFVQKTLRRFHVHECPNAVGHLVEGVNSQGQIHAASGAELIDQDLRSGMALDVFKKQSRPAGLHRGNARASIFAHAVGDFSNLENGIHFGVDGLQFAGALQRRDPIPQIFVGQIFPRLETAIIRQRAVSKSLKRRGVGGQSGLHRQGVIQSEASF